MKFILSEEKAKLFLLERYILNEAGDDPLSDLEDREAAANQQAADEKAAQEDSASKIATKEKLAKYTDALKNKLINLSNNADQEWKDYFAQYDAKKKAADEAIERNDWGAVEQPIKDFTNEVRKLAEADKNAGAGSPLNAAKDLKRNLDECDALAKRLKSRLSDATKGKIVLEDLRDYFGRVVAVMDAEKEAKRPKAKDDQAFDTLVEETWKAISNADKALDTIKGNAPETEALIKSLDNSLVDIDTEADTYNISEKLTTIKEGCNKFATAVTNADSFNAKTADTVAKGAKDNWSKAFAEAGDDRSKVMKLWDDYYITEWADMSEKVKALGSTFTTELLNLGFSEALNPFITFVRYALQNNYNLTATTYPAVHNAYVEDFISKDDLRKTSALSAANNNILYCKALYDLGNARLIYTYFNYQDNIKRNYKNRDAALKRDGMYADDDANLGAFIVACFDESLPLDKLGNTKERRNFSSIGTLRSTNDIKTAIATCLGEGATTVKTEKPSPEATKIIPELDKYNLTALAPTYLANNYGYANEKWMNLVNECGGWQTTAFTQNNAKALGKIFSGYAADANKMFTVAQEIAKQLKERTKQK